MIKAAGIDFSHLPDEDFDNPLGLSTGAADIFGLTGGVMEAALRTVYELVTGREIPFDGLHVTPIVGLEQVKEAGIKIENPLPEYDFLDGVEVKIAVTSGLAGASKLMKQVENGESPYHFIEVMGCPGGCIMGGGQPRSTDEDVRTKRMKGLYSEDESKALRKSHENPYIKTLYEEYLGEPNGHRSHELLHTHYVPRGEFNELTDSTYVLEIDRQEKKPAQPGAGMTTGKRKMRIDPEPPKLLELESENRRLQSELKDSIETVDILKMVIADMAPSNQ